MSNTNTPLHFAVQNGNVEIVKTLLARGYDQNVRNADGLTPLDLAIATNNTAITQLLLEHTNKVQTVGKDGQTVPSSTGIVNKLFMLWKDVAIFLNIVAVVFLFVCYIVWIANLPADTTFYDAHIIGLTDIRTYGAVATIFIGINLAAPFLNLMSEK